MLRIERGAGDHRRESVSVNGRERDTGMAAGNESAGVAFGLIVDRETILRHHAEARPTTHDVHIREIGNMRCARSAMTALIVKLIPVIGRIFLAVADHDSAFVGLAERVRG